MRVWLMMFAVLMVLSGTGCGGSECEKAAKVKCDGMTGELYDGCVERAVDGCAR
jgi:hypothetical protein